MREVVRAVARLFPTAIISGRGREKVEGFVKLKELYYAGSHGMDIIGPRVRSLQRPLSHLLGDLISVIGGQLRMVFLHC